MTFTTETCNQNLVVFFNVVQATVPGYERRDLLAVLNKLNPDALADGRVGLFGFNTTVMKIRLQDLIYIMLKYGK